MPIVDWKRFALAALAVVLIGNLAANYFDRREATEHASADQQSSRGADLKIVVTSHSSDGVTEDQLSPKLAEALAKHGEERLAAKLQALATQAGLARPTPQIRSQAAIVQAQGRKLVVIRFQIDNTASAVEVIGISGPNALRVMCTRDSLEEILLTIGACAEKIKEIHGVTLGA